MRVLWTWAAIVLVFGVFDLACINVSLIQATDDGGFHCDPTALGVCPLGYFCSPLTSACQPRSFDAASDSPRDAHPFEAPAEVGPDVAPDAGADQPGSAGSDAGDDQSDGACVMPVPGCTPDTSKRCDPVCQTGCTGCGQKCSSNPLGALTCNLPLDAHYRALGETCDIASPNTAAQTDNCAPGLVCLQDACGARCYHFCNTDADCPGSTCTRDAGGGVKICDVQATLCNPVKDGTPSGCASVAQGCYLSTKISDTTICDCPFQAGGTNTSCSISRDCFFGLACVGPIGSSVCRPVCHLDSAVDCGPASTCTALNGSRIFGYCN